MAAKSLDKILLGSSAVVLLGAVGWMAYQSSSTAQVALSTPSNVAPYESIGIDAPTVSTSTWSEPPPQSTGSEWVFDVFTPPEIYYYTDSKKFEVKRTKVPPPPPPPPAPFGVALKEVRPDVFRLQLVGYVGRSQSEYRGNFENTLSGKTVIGASGKELPDLGLKIKSFEVKRHVITSKESMPIIDYEAIAVVVDIKTGDEVTLTNKRRHVQGEPFAILSSEAEGAEIRKKAGESFQVGDATYTVVSITQEPPSAVVRKESPALKEPRTETITPQSTVAPEPTTSTPAPQPEPSAPANVFPGL